jgi:hypothetical protein
LKTGSEGSQLDRTVHAHDEGRNGCPQEKRHAPPARPERKTFKCHASSNGYLMYFPLL